MGNSEFQDSLVFGRQRILELEKQASRPFLKMSYLGSSPDFSFHSRTLVESWEVGVRSGVRIVLRIILFGQPVGRKTINFRILSVENCAISSLSWANSVDW